MKRQMRSASLTYVQQRVKSKGQNLSKLNKHIGEARKSVEQDFEG
jgi:hypothetical protein